MRGHAEQPSSSRGGTATSLEFPNGGACHGQKHLSFSGIPAHPDVRQPISPLSASHSTTPEGFLSACSAPGLYFSSI